MHGLVRGALTAAGIMLLTLAPRAAAAEFDPLAFTDRHCSSCHNDVDKEGGLDLTALPFTLDDAANLATWVKIHDRLRADEMPPKEKKRPVAAEQQAYLATIAARLTAADQAIVQREGRATRRRLNRYEYENALRDLLDTPWLQLKDRLPEDGVANGFNKIGEALDVSHVHMARYMTVADYALREVVTARLLQPETKTVRYYSRDENSLTQFTVGFRVGSGTPDRAWFPCWAPRPNRKCGRGGPRSRWVIRSEDPRAGGRGLGLEQLRHRLPHALAQFHRAGDGTLSDALQRLHRLGRARGVQDELP